MERFCLILLCIAVNPAVGLPELNSENAYYTTEKVVEHVVQSPGEKFDICVSGAATPVMKSIRIECIEGAVKDAWVLNDNTVDTFSIEGILSSVIKSGMTDLQKMEALADYVAGDRFIHSAYVPADYDTLKILNVYGFGFCAAHSSMLYHLAARAGIPVLFYRVDYAGGHTVVLAHVAGDWRIFDTDVTGIVRNENGLPISLSDIEKKPELVWNGADEFLMAKTGRITYITVAALLLAARENTDLGYLTPEPTGAVFPRTAVSAQCWKKFLEQGTLPDPPQLPQSYDLRCHSMSYVLSSGECLDREWLPCTLDSPKMPALSRNGIHSPRFGKGTLTCNLSAQNLFNKAKSTVENVQGLSVSNFCMRDDALVIEDCSKRAYIVFPIRTNYILCSSHVSLDLSGSGKGKWSWSKDKGKTWQQGPEFTFNSAQKCEAEIPSDGVDEVYVKTELCAVPSLNAAKLHNFSMVSDLQVFQGTLPALHLGNNSISVRTAPSSAGKVKITYKWLERFKKPAALQDSIRYGWSKAQDLQDFQGKMPVPSTLKSDRLFIVWQEDSRDRTRIALADFDGKKWSGKKIIAENESADLGYPDIAADSNSLHVVYQQGSSSGSSDVFYLCSDNNSWSKPQQLNLFDPMHRAHFPRIALGQDGKAVCVWQGINYEQVTRRGPLECVYFSRIGPGILTKPEMLAFRGVPFIAAGKNCVYLCNKKISVDGITGSEIYLGDMSMMTFGSRLFTAENGTVHGVFDAYTSCSSNEIYTRKLANGRCGDLIRISDDDNFKSVYPDVAADAQGRICVVWMDYRLKNPQVYAKLIDGTNRTPEIRLSDPGLSCKYPRISCLNSRFYVFWFRLTEKGPAKIQWCTGLFKD